jgi:hypothetical protein
LRRFTCVGSWRFLLAAILGEVREGNTAPLADADKNRVATHHAARINPRRALVPKVRYPIPQHSPCIGLHLYQVTRRDRTNIALEHHLFDEDGMSIDLGLVVG